MALIEVFHVVASQFDVDPNGTPDIPQGSVVALDPSGSDAGEVILAQATTAARAIGIAGDSRANGVTSYTPESGSALSRNPGDGTGALVVGSYGRQTRYTENRVADQKNEVLASGKMTVYHSGGEFWTDMYESHGSTGTSLTSNYTPGALLYTSTTGSTGTDDEPDNGGRFTTENVSSFGWVVGQLIQGPLAYPSGVPGTTTSFNQLPEGGNSLSWGQFIRLKLMV